LVETSVRVFDSRCGHWNFSLPSVKMLKPKQKDDEAHCTGEVSNKWVDINFPATHYTELPLHVVFKTNRKLEQTVILLTPESR